MLAVAALASCMKEQTLSTQQPGAIAFDNAILDNALRSAVDPSTTTATLNAFDVWAFMDEASGVVFEGEDVTKNGTWTYTNTQYWAPNHTYYFAALAPMNSANWTLNTAEANELGAGVVSFTNVNGTEDVLYAATSVVTPDAATLAQTNMEKVKFQFNHLLSKVKFTFKNAFTTENAYVVVKNVTMSAPKTGTLALNAADWWTGDKWALGTDAVELAFGDVAKLAMGEADEAANERLTIPAAAGYVYEINFTVELYMGDVLAATCNKIATVSDVALEMGKAYNFAAEINADNLELQAIEFDVLEVKAWEEAADDVEFLPATAVATAAELQTAVERGENVVLTADVNLDELGTKAGAYSGLEITKDVVIDGNGYTATTTAVRAILVLGAKNVTVKNLTLDAPQSERGFQIQEDGQTLVLENVVATSANRTVNVTATSSNAKVSIKNCVLNGLTPLNVWGENHEVTVENTVITCTDNTDAENYAAIYNTAENTTIVVNGGEVVVNDDSFTYGIFEDTAAVVFNGTKGNLENCANHAFAIYYGVDRYTFATFAEAIEAAKDGETIEILQNVSLDTYVNIANKNVIVNLNGNNIVAAANGDATAFGVAANGKLTINGEGQVKATGRPVWVYGADAEVVINGGHFIGSSETSECEVVYVNGANSKVIINGGKFEAAHPSVGTADEYAVLNVYGNRANGADIVVNGGSFYKFNPANNKSEGANTNFVTAGKTVEQNGDWYIVK